MNAADLFIIYNQLCCSCFVCQVVPEFTSATFTVITIVTTLLLFTTPSLLLTIMVLNPLPHVFEDRRNPGHGAALGLGCCSYWGLVGARGI